MALTAATGEGTYVVFCQNQDPPCVMHYRPGGASSEPRSAGAAFTVGAAGLGAAATGALATAGASVAGAAAALGVYLV